MVDLIDLEDGPNSPPRTPYNRIYGPFTFESGSPSRIEEYDPDQSGCSSAAQKIPPFDVEVGEQARVNKKNRLKASLA